MTKVEGYIEYDNRMEQVCENIMPDLDVRNLVIQTKSTPASHHSQNRPSVEEILENYAIDKPRLHPTPTRIGIVDDVLTLGAHYRAMHAILSKEFPNIPIIGIFVARTIPPPNPFVELAHL